MGRIINPYAFLAPAAWTPAQLFLTGDKGAWYDPSDFSTMWQDTAGTTAVTATGQTVKRIDDKSGNGNHLSYATGPILRQDGSGYYYLEFTAASGECLFASLNTGWSTLTHDLVVATAAKFNNSPPGNEYLLTYTVNGSAPARWAFGYSTGFNQFVLYRPQGTSAATDHVGASYSSTSVHVQSAASVLDGSSHHIGDLRIDGSTVASGADCGIDGSSNALPMIMGAYGDGSGSAPLAGTFFDGNMYGAVVWIGTYDSTTRGKIDTYLGQKCGLTV